MQSRRHGANAAESSDDTSRVTLDFPHKIPIAVNGDQDNFSNTGIAEEKLATQRRGAEKREP